MLLYDIARNREDAISTVCINARICYCDTECHEENVKDYFLGGKGGGWRFEGCNSVSFGDSEGCPVADCDDPLSVKLSCVDTICSSTGLKRVSDSSVADSRIALSRPEDDCSCLGRTSNSPCLSTTLSSDIPSAGRSLTAIRFAPREFRLLIDVRCDSEGKSIDLRFVSSCSAISLRASDADVVEGELAASMLERIAGEGLEFLRGGVGGAGESEGNNRGGNGGGISLEGVGVVFIDVVGRGGDRCNGATSSLFSDDGFADSGTVEDSGGDRLETD